MKSTLSNYSQIFADHLPLFMAKRDPELTARNKLIKELTLQLKDMLPEVLRVTGFDSELSLHGKIGGKFADYIDIKNVVIHSPDHFSALWLEGYQRVLSNIHEVFRPNDNQYQTYLLLQQHEIFRKYLFLFLERTYLRNYDALSKKKPTIEESEIWFGQNNADYGFLITPRFNGTNWENDKSEIRHFQKRYWTIGHVLETGFVIPHKNKRRLFTSVDDYLNFFTDVLVRNSGSVHEYKLAELYAAFVQGSDEPEQVPLLIPEFRYLGIARQHEYRLDFTIIESQEMMKVGFELSPWSSHGYLSKTKHMTQKEINEIAKGNFEKEMKKHKTFFKKHGIAVMIYTDSDLADIDSVFKDMVPFLQPRQSSQQMKYHILNDFFKNKI